jgi:SWI/SNF-related matrix-associated actin-dependent regulator 1 of chromatin subfamily A
MPVGPASSLDVVLDFEVQRNIERIQTVLPHASEKSIQSALELKKGSYQQALEFLTSGSVAPIEESEDELFSPVKPIILAKSTAKREVKANKSIAEKFSTIRATGEEPVKKKGRLMRGRRNHTPQPSPQRAASTPKGKTAGTAVGSEDSDEGIAILSGSDSDTSEEKTLECDKDTLLGFFNSCSVEEMVDLSNQKEEVVRAVFTHRPFKSLREVEKVTLEPQTSGGKKSRRPLMVGEKLVEFASNMWAGYNAIDRLVTKCEKLGKPIAATMAQWGARVPASRASPDGGALSLTTLEAAATESNSNTVRDSGIGTPRSDSDSEGSACLPSKANASTSNFLEKPANMAGDMQLKDYQLVGLNWLNLLWKHGMSCILADDMGLGKTCQVIAFLSHLHERNVEGPHVIIVPGSTLENWLREFQKFSPTLAVEPYYGSQGARTEQQVKILDNIESIDVIVTTYDLAYKKLDNSFLRKCKPNVCVFDEGHVLKNSGTQRYKSLMRIPAKFRLLLTGTPLQNNLRELASILAFIMPDLFMDLEEDLAFVFKHKAKTSDTDHGALLSAQRVTRARSMMAPFVLRRKKAQVLHNLPKKTYRVEYCDLTESQATLYAEQLEKQRKVLEDRAAGLPVKDQTNIMMRLRQAAIHPLLFRSRYNDNILRKIAKACLKEPTFRDSNPQYIFEDMEVYQDFQCHQLALKYPTYLGKYALQHEEWMDSGKVKKLVELLKKFKENGDRTLIFSQFTTVMDILETVLDSIDMSFFRLDGSTPISQRQDMLDMFYEDLSVPVFMLSTKSGGAGINLACANKVIIFDSSFNPQEDIQAENRAHRVGQTRDVEVIKLVTRGTVEEQIHALGVSKLELDKLVAGEEAASEATSSAKKSSELKLSAAEQMGIEAVEEMLMEQLVKKEKKDERADKPAGDGADVKQKYLNGLKAAGLDMSAA